MSPIFLSDDATARHSSAAVLQNNV